jgi:FlaA1/EpsC-like NDP-sugar epimerase
MSASDGLNVAPDAGSPSPLEPAAGEATASIRRRHPTAWSKHRPNQAYRLQSRPWTISRIRRGVRKHAPAALLDALAVLLAYQIAVLLRFDGAVPHDVVAYFLPSLPVVVLIFVGANLVNGIYWRVWHFAGLSDALALVRAVALALAAVLVIDIAIGMPLHKRPVPLSVVLAGSAFTLLAMGAIKLTPRLRRRPHSGAGANSGAERVLIVGAGEAGQGLVRDLRGPANRSYIPVCFVDDDPAKSNLRVHSVPIVGTRADIPMLVERLDVDVVAVAIPSAPGDVLREIVEISQRAGAKVRLVPGVSQILEGRSGMELLRDVTVEDLLGREPVQIDLGACNAYIGAKVVLLTGAAGSIGSELSRQVLRLEPTSLILLDSNESGLHDLAMRLRRASTGTQVEVAVCNVERREAVLRVFEQHRPDVVFHAAAYKHVPLMEQHPDQAIMVNVIGTRNVCLAADALGVQRFVLISTDKAVNPANVMGATKRVCEELVRSLGTVSSTALAPASGEVGASGEGGVTFCAVRFGNVLDSRGSVIPTFAWQIDQGGPVTVTHPEMRRFFMTIPEAASLVIQAGAYARSGDLFLLDMGDEMNITDLAEKMILLRGLRPGRDIQITYTGLRPGEKLREELTVEHESLQATPHTKINRIDARPAIDRSRLLSAVEELAATATSGDAMRLRTRLFALVDECERTGHEGDMMAALPRG